MAEDEDRTPLVAIVMGSDSDLKNYGKNPQKQLDEFDVPYEIIIISAHRDPEKLDAVV
eukprot:TRINITY_DN8722_c0_g1_i1.p2 TRINITY_DN8722_c0_g1~~TRINITY_DN8722_c0_g1_i1.p2  ORF type:complete len:58 (+),score=18.68 TRINITY_DN8722_c0_g1_i1:87-260(+)